MRKRLEREREREREGGGEREVTGKMEERGEKLNWGKKRKIYFIKSWLFVEENKGGNEERFFLLH